MPSSDQMVEQAIYYDWMADLPSGLWHIGTRTIRMRTHVLARGFRNSDDQFIVRNILKVLRHEPEPDDWAEPSTPAGMETARGR